MRDLHIKLSIIDFITILDVHIFKKVNEHGYASIKGIIKEKDEAMVFRKAEIEEYAVLSISDEDGKSQNVFAGVVANISVENTGGVKTARILLKGATMLMDCIPYTGTFQDVGLRYEQLLDTVNEKYRDITYRTGCGQAATTNKLIVQYQETDWEFIKRLASHFNQPIIPAYSEQGINYSFGLIAGGNVKELKETTYKTENNVTEYQVKNENKVPGIFFSDFQTYEVKSREYMELGECVSFKGRNFYVYEAESFFEGEEILHVYKLRSKGGFSKIKKYNTKLIGASLSGCILDIKKDTVRIKLDVDETQDRKTARWFPYSTVYSSADGTGFYCMPEKQDNIRLYFPNEKEEEAYVISSINTESAQIPKLDSKARSNPDNKSISNKYQKQIELTPTSITITNNKGMRICLDDEKGIDIISDKKVKIESDSQLLIKTAARMDVKALSAIHLIQGNTKLKMEDEITVEGARFKVQ